MENNINPLIIEESPETINKLKEELNKKERRYQNIYNIGVTLTKVGTPALIGSVLSPFDFEGPVIEIISAITLLCGLGMKSYGELKKKELKEEKKELFEQSKQEMKANLEDIKEDLLKIVDYQKSKQEVKKNTR